MAKASVNSLQAWLVEQGVMQAGPVCRERYVQFGLLLVAMLLLLATIRRSAFFLSL